MSYRRESKQESWSQWRRKNHDLILASGLPELFLESEERWLNFLEHGYYECFPMIENPLSWFELDELTTEQKQALAALIKTYPDCQRTDVARWVEKQLEP